MNVGRIIEKPDSYLDRKDYDAAGRKTNYCRTEVEVCGKGLKFDKFHKLCPF